MKIIITINASEKEIKNAIAKGWNNRFGEDLKGSDVEEVSNKEDILSAVPYLDTEYFKIDVRK